MNSPDVVICGLGPAGRALAHRCAARGLTVTAVDPAPQRRWHATYACWSDELPRWLDRRAVAATVPYLLAYGNHEHRIPREYTVFDTERLQESLDLNNTTVLTDRVVEVDRYRVALDSGTALRAERVIDARGVRRSPVNAEQTAYGVFVDARTWTTPMVFMDWRPDNGAATGAPRSFLYTIPVDDDTILLEETCLAGLPALTPSVLAERLWHRLRARGIELNGAERVERVRFPVTGGRPSAGRFGAAGAFTHPATGYSVGAALAAADAVAAGGSPSTGSTRAVHRLRSAGLRALLNLPSDDLPRFFDSFFRLPEHLQRAYLSGRGDLPGTAAAMTRIFADLPTQHRRHLAAATFRLPRPLRPGSGSTIAQ